MTTKIATTTPATPAAVDLGTLQAASPGALVAGASEMAGTLANVIRSQSLAVNLKGKEYVQVEGWTTLATMLGVTAREVQTTETDGIYTSTVELVRMSDGAVISRASAECGAPDETDRYGKPIWSARPRYARRSMAQTRATGKACRLAFSWIMRLAGYEATPAEEMQFLAEEQPTGAQRPSRTAAHTAAHTGAPQPARQSEAPTQQPTQAQQQPRISSAQHKRLEARINELGLDRERVKRWCASRWQVGHFPDLSPAQYDELDRRLPGFARQSQQEVAA